MMAVSRISGLAAAALVAAVAMPAAAVAAHGKAGLWKITVTLQGAGHPLPGISASDLAQMKAMGVQIPNTRVVSTQHCMTAAEVSSQELSALRQPAGSGCALTNKAATGQTFTADMVCTGEMKGRGQVVVSYDSPEHYTGRTTFSGTAHGRPAQMTTILEGRWIAASCGSVQR